MKINYGEQITPTALSNVEPGNPFLWSGILHVRGNNNSIGGKVTCMRLDSGDFISISLKELVQPVVAEVKVIKFATSTT